MLLGCNTVLGDCAVCDKKGVEGDKNFVESGLAGGDAFAL